MRVQPSNCPFSVILFQIHERWASLDAEAIPLLLNGVALGVYRADMDADRLRRAKRTNGSVTKYPGQQCNSQRELPLTNCCCRDAAKIDQNRRATLTGLHLLRYIRADAEALLAEILSRSTEYAATGGPFPDRLPIVAITGKAALTPIRGIGEVHNRRGTGDAGLGAIVGQQRGGKRCDR